MKETHHLRTFLLLLSCLSISLISTPVWGKWWGKEKKIEGEIDGKKETRIPRDCGKEIEYQARAFSLKVDILNKIKFEGSTEKKAIREVEGVLELLQWQSQELCKDWNTLAVTREEYNRKAEWIRKVFSSFTMLLSSVKLSDLEDPSLKREFLQRLLKWFENTARENEEVKVRWEEIKGELKELKKEVKEAAEKGAEAGAERAVQRLIEKGVLSPPIPKEEIRKEIESLRAQLSKEKLERAKILAERGTERLETEKYEEAIKDLEEALGILPEGSEASLSTHFNLGLALIRFPRGDREVNLRKAIESYNKVLSVHTKEETPEQYARAQGNLGFAYWGLSEVRDKEANLGLAIKAYNKALIVFTSERFPQDYARAQNNLGIAYGGLSEVRDREDNLGLAMKAFNEALIVFTSERFPQDYARAQGNLGIAYRGLSEVRDKEANLGLAIKAYEEALRVYTFEKFPQYYALTQNNLGVAYGGLSEVRDKEANIALAIKAYNEALRVYTFYKFPRDYAGTQYNLGNAYGGLSGVRDREDNLGLAIGCYKEALRVYTKEALPWYFVVTSGNLAVALSMKGDIAGALKVLEDMLPVAEEVGHPGLEDFRRFYAALKSGR